MSGTSTKPCRACGEEIAASANLCHHCGTPQRGPLWLFQWKDLAGALIAILALLPWFAGFYAFVLPQFVPPEPKLHAVVYQCDRAAVSLGIVNTGKAFAFLRSFRLVSTVAPFRSFELVPKSGQPLGDKSVLNAGQVASFDLLSVMGRSKIEQPLPDGAKCSLNLEVHYSDENGQDIPAQASCACDKQEAPS